MIISNDISPYRDIYFLGARIIEILDESEAPEFDFFELFNIIHNRTGISINLYVLVLDWLYIIGAISNANNGFVKKCF